MPSDFLLKCVVATFLYVLILILIQIIIIQTIFNAMLGFFLYTIVVEPQAKLKESRHHGESIENKSREKNVSGNPTDLLSQSLLFAFGIALPFVFLEGEYIVRALEIHNLGLVMVLLATPIVNSLRIMEAVFGFTPYPARRSLRNFVIYFSSTQSIDFDRVSGDPKQVSLRFFGKRLATLARDFAINCALFSILKPFNYEPFETNREVHSMDRDLTDLFSWQHLFNNYLIALLISSTVSQGTIGVSLLFNIFYGCQTSEIMLNPMVRSKSPSDFWGRRWNTLVHEGLKNGVYKPIRKHSSSRIIAVAGSFVVSGIIHEYVNFVMFRETMRATDGAKTSYLVEWKQMLFFGWNGILIALEYSIGHWSIFKWISKSIPQILVTALVICSALPLAHFFTGDWIRHGYFDSVYIGEPVILCRYV
mmetsp:Transcript_14668/g.40772  ORF Transcript_14668/g.40772 Transcript_14668/m.40772 type:complete len:420 (+) Transcript_14668:915-2174(+)